MPVAAVVHYGAYTGLGVPPYDWYYGPAIVLTTMFLAAASAAALICEARGWWRAPRVGVVVAAVLLAGADIGTYSAPGLPRTFAPITTNWASTAAYRQIGRQLPRLVGNGAVGGPPEVGVIDYYCDCNVYESFSDRGHFPAELARYEQRIGPVGKAVMQLNFANLDKSIRPRPTQFVLTTAAYPDPHAIRNWLISSPWMHPQYMVLRRT